MNSTNTLDLDRLNLAYGEYAGRRSTIEQRLWGRLDVVDSDCWEWQGTRSRQGYGYLGFRGRTQKAHRVAWTLSRGEIPEGRIVMHLCDNPPCCNPDHLRLGTVQENNRDRQEKGRTVLPTNSGDYLRKRTHCPKGHPYSGDNLRLRPSGSRRCAACYREAARRYARAVREAAK